MLADMLNRGNSPALGPPPCPTRSALPGPSSCQHGLCGLDMQASIILHTTSSKSHNFHRLVPPVGSVSWRPLRSPPTARQTLGPQGLVSCRQGVRQLGESEHPANIKLKWLHKMSFVQILGKHCPLRCPRIKETEGRQNSVPSQYLKRQASKHGALPVHGRKQVWDLHPALAL